ncbi:MAG TPA: FKBP-type peptidyl-prolyl cis-trans isomerase N-terminal domain-containing protein [Paludibacter sp.]|nr:FKBP-type peptidyl-prolyl cis-trans isomerase N-terminal domain-containing protein [Paludibacter sp.]
MKKQSILSLVALVAIFAMTSCNKYEGKTISLKNQNDSLNYTLGLANSQNIKQYYMQKDSGDKPIVALMKALDKAYKGGDKDEMYKLGLKIGNSFKQQKASGLMGDSTLAFNEDLVKQGLINALNGFDKGMTAKEAQEYIQKTMTRIQMKRMGQNQPAAPQAAPDTTNIQAN